MSNIKKWVDETLIKSIMKLLPKEARENIFFNLKRFGLDFDQDIIPMINGKIDKEKLLNFTYKACIENEKNLLSAIGWLEINFGSKAEFVIQKGVNEKGEPIAIVEIRTTQGSTYIHFPEIPYFLDKTISNIKIIEESKKEKEINNHSHDHQLDGPAAG